MGQSGSRSVPSPLCTTPSVVVKGKPLYVYLFSVFTRCQNGEDERSLDLPLPLVAGILTLLKSDLQTFLIYKK